MQRLSLVPLCTLAALALPAAVQEMDMAAMQKWANARTIHYTVGGVYSGGITPTMGGLADVTETMAMGLPPTKELSYSPDGKSMIVKQGNWSWTFTPSLAKPK